MNEEKDILLRLTALEEKLNQDLNFPMNFREACEYLGFAPSYLYKLTYQNIIPHYKPSGKRLYFFKKELDEWIIRGSDECRVKSYELKNENGSTSLTTKDPNQIEMNLDLKSKDEICEKENGETEILIEFPLKSRRKRNN